MQFKETKLNQFNNVSGGEDLFKWIKKLAVLKENNYLIDIQENTYYDRQLNTA